MPLPLRPGRAALLAALALLPALVATAAPNPISIDPSAGVHAEVETLTPAYNGTAQAARLRLVNHSGETRVYRATLGDGWSDTDNLVETITLPPHETRTVEMTLGMRHNQGSMLMIKLDGPGTDGGSRYLSSGGGHSTSAGNRSLALGPQVATEAQSRLTDLNTVRLDTAPFTEDWRTLRAASSLILTHKDWREATRNPASRDAILRYVAQGGHLALVGEADEPAPAGLPALRDGRHHGFGLITRHTGALSNFADTATGPGASIKNDANPFRVAAVLATENPSIETAALGLPPRTDARIAVGLLITLFALIAGPVNLFVFCRPPYRHRLLITTPALALGTSLLIGGVILIADGVGLQGEVVRVRLRPAGGAAEFLDSVEHSRAGLLLGNGFTVPEGAFLRRLDGDATTSYSHNTGSHRIENGRASGDWYRSRADRVLGVEAWHSARGTLTLGGTAGKPTVTSTLDGVLREVVIIPPGSKKVFRVAEITPGATLPLTDDPKAAVELQTLIDSPGLSTDQKARLRAFTAGTGIFVARTDGLRGAEAPLNPDLRATRRLEILCGELAAPVSAESAR